MKIIVQKYGGSSVSTIEKIDFVAQRIISARKKGYAVVAVVSAMGNTTDNLLALAREIMPEPPSRELDMLLSTGERVTMSLVSIAVQKYGENAISFTGSQSGIITNDCHSGAKIISVRPYRIQDELARDKVVIVAGFQGTSYKNEITTLGRGGSDMTAIALAGALNAEACEIYSDVDGVCTADPRVVLDAKKLSEISAAEMLALAQQGAKVLHDDAVLYAQRNGIALYAKKTGQEQSGTFIRPDNFPDREIQQSRPVIKAVAGCKRLLVIGGNNDRFGDFLALVTRVEGTKLLALEKNEEKFDAFFDTWNCTDHDAVKSRFENLGLLCRSDLSNVSLVGLGIGRDYGRILAIQNALELSNLSPVHIHCSVNVILLTFPSSQSEDASRILHRLVET